MRSGSRLHLENQWSRVTAGHAVVLQPLPETVDLQPPDSIRAV